MLVCVDYVDSWKGSGSCRISVGGIFCLCIGVWVVVVVWLFRYGDYVGFVGLLVWFGDILVAFIWVIK